MTTLPLDFDIFLRSGSSTQPEMAASLHGSSCSSSSERSTVVNSQVRMMSCACGRTSKGNTLREELLVLPGLPGDLGRQRGGRPRVHHVGVAGEAARPAALGGLVPVGDVGRGVDRQLLVGEAASGRSWRIWPCSSISYQTGNGTPKKRWRLMHQSPVRPFTQSSKRARM